MAGVLGKDPMVTKLEDIGWGAHSIEGNRIGSVCIDPLKADQITLFS